MCCNIMETSFVEKCLHQCMWAKVQHSMYKKWQHFVDDFATINFQCVGKCHFNSTRNTTVHFLRGAELWAGNLTYCKTPSVLKQAKYEGRKSTHYNIHYLWFLWYTALYGVHHWSKRGGRKILYGDVAKKVSAARSSLRYHKTSVVSVSSLQIRQPFCQRKRTSQWAVAWANHL